MRIRVIATLLTASACSAIPHPSLGSSPESSLSRTLALSEAMASRGDFAAADSALAAFAVRYPGTAEALETSYWRALYKLDPSNRGTSLTSAMATLDGYLSDTRPRAHVSEAITLRRLAGQLDALNRLAANAASQARDALDFQIQNLLKLYDDRRTLTAGPLGLQEKNPQIDAIDQRIRQGNTALKAAVAATLQSLNNRLSSLDATIRQMKNRLKSFPGQETQIAQLQIESQIASETYKYMLGQYQAAEMQQATVAPYVTLLDGASPPYRIGTTLMQKVLLGFLVGLLLGLAGAFFLEYLDQTIKSSADVQRVVGVPVLAQIPYDSKLAVSGNGRSRHAVIVITSLDPDDPAAEAYRALRTNVTFVGAEKPLQFILVTSAMPGEGKSTTAVHLASAHADQGKRTLIIDADLRRPSVHRKLDIQAKEGLSNVLLGDVTWRNAIIYPDGRPNLHVLLSGPPSRRASDLIGPMMADILEEAAKEYDLIVVDAPPVLGFAEAMQIARAVDGVVMLARAGKTNRKAVGTSLEILNRLRANIVGLVLNGVTKEHGDSYYYSGHYRKYYAALPVQN